MTFSIFGLTGSWYGLTVGVSALCFLCLAGVLGYKRGLPAGTIRLFGLIALPLGLIGSRLVFCAANFAYFTEEISQPLKMLCFWDGGYSMVGAMGGMIAAAWITSRLAKVRFATLFDVTACALPLFVIGARIAEGFTGALGVGRQVDVGTLAQTAPWLFLQETLGTLTLYRLAVYRYEAVVAALLLAVTLALFFSQKTQKRARKGDLGMLAFAMYGACQVVLESLRDDGHLLLGFIRVSQLACALMPVLALIVFGARYAHIRRARPTVAVAWLLLPVAAVVALMMLVPINHVLDLTGKRAVGFAVLAAIGLYWAFFLRKQGADLRLILTWLLVLLCVAGCVMVEFSIDGSSNLLRDYAIMALCALGVFLAPCTLWHTLAARVYREETIHMTKDVGKRLL